jgi:hypothetical protein
MTDYEQEQCNTSNKALEHLATDISHIVRSGGLENPNKTELMELMDRLVFMTAK